MSCGKETTAKAAKAARTNGIPGLANRNAARFRVGKIDWRQRKLIGGGGLAVIYEVAPGVVAKVGDVQPEEARAQRYFARQGQALPVWDYAEEVALPDEVSQEVCAIHGERSSFLPDGYECTCGSAQAVLLMPKANVAGVKAEEAQAFMAGFAQDCYEQLGRYWDARPANVARYQGRLVALDFGEE
jgi:hypothetical protein